MKKRRLVVLNCILFLFIGMLLHLSDDCLVLAREGLSDAELYGNGQESILYQGSSPNKILPSYDKKAYTKQTGNDSSEAKTGKGIDSDSSEAKNGKKADNNFSEAKDKKEKITLSEAGNEEEASGNALTEVTVSGDAYIKEEDIVITGVEPNGIYNKTVTIAISVIKANEAPSVLAGLYKVSEGQNADGKDVEDTMASDNMTNGDGTVVTDSLKGEVVTGNQTENIDNSRSGQIGLQIGLSATGQLVSGKKQVSEDGRYELVIWQEVNEGQELSDEQPILKKLNFTVDMTVPIIDRELINSLCKDKIDVGEICREAVWDESKVTTSCFVNEQKVSQGVIERPGEYELIVKAEDEAGNQTQEELQITLQDEEQNQKKHSRFMAPSIIVLLFGGSMLVRERRREKKEDKYEQRDK